jgi:predicted exporter
VLSFLGRELSLLHVLSLVLVLSIGVDYSVFLVESRNEPARAGTTLTSLLAAWLTTLGSFGLLALSQAPALRAIGETIALGVTFSLILAPLGMAWLGSRAARATEPEAAT